MIYGERVLRASDVGQLSWQRWQQLGSEGGCRDPATPVGPQEL